MSELKASDIRTRKKRDKLPCFVCGNHAGITVWHHILPLGEIADGIDYYLDSEWYPGGVDNTVVCLCPNCHAYVHLMAACNERKIGTPAEVSETDWFKSFVANYSIEERAKLKELWKIKEELR